LKEFFKKKAKADARKTEELKRAADDLKMKTTIPVTQQTKFMYQVIELARFKIPGTCCLLEVVVNNIFACDSST